MGADLELKLILVGNSTSDPAAAEKALRDSGISCTLRLVQDSKALHEAPPPDAFLWDLDLSDLDGSPVIEACRRIAPEAPLFLLAGCEEGDDAKAAKILKQGAADYLFKNRLRRLGPALLRTVTETRERALRRDAERKLERQLSQAQKMEAVGRLAGGVAHDFNNVLTIIGGYGEMLLSSLPDKDPLRNYAQQILEAGECAASMTRQLLAFSRRQVFHPDVLDLNIVVNDMNRMLRQIIPENIELKTSLSQDLKHVKADRSQIEQVLMNLVINARDAMPDGGCISLRTLNAILDVPPNGRKSGPHSNAYVLLSVGDTGIGMDESTKTRIFEPFFTTKEAGRGTGLGLSTVYGIVRQSGGFIQIESELHRGSTFKVYIPRTLEQPNQRSETKSDYLFPVGSKTILVVEDSDTIRHLTCEILKSSGNHVLQAANGPEALTVASRHKGPIHLLLTDVVMPGMSGLELTRRLLSVRRDIKVLYASGYSREALARHGSILSGTPFLEKPYNPGTLLRMVRKTLATPKTA